MAPTRESFIETVIRRYAGGRERLFLLHGNTGDLFPFQETRYTLPDYCYQALTARAGDDGRRIWQHFSLDRGIRWINEARAHGAARIATLLGSKGEAAIAFTRQPLDFIRLITDVSLRKEKVGDADCPIPLRVILTDAHLVVPDAPAHFMRENDRELLVHLKRFAADPMYDATDTLIVLVTDALSGIHHELREVAVTIEIPRPNEEEADAALSSAEIRYERKADESLRSALRRQVIGLTRRQIENIVAEGEITPEILAARRREFTMRDYGDQLEFFDPTWTLDSAGGSPEAVAELRHIADALARGDRDVPPGIILVGPNGIGKTFLAKAFLGSVRRLTGVEMRSPFGSLVGESERNMERMATGIRSAGDIGVLVDEADTVMGNRAGPNVHEVSRRVFAIQMELMGDPTLRGKVFWILMTCRPDKLAPDVKRAGRCERVIPLFPVATEAEGQSMISAIRAYLEARSGFTFAITEDGECELAPQVIRMTGGQIERLFRRARRHASGGPITPEHVRSVLAGDAALKAEAEAGELQRLIAIVEAVETHNADLIPLYYQKEIAAHYKGMNGVRARVDELRNRLDR